MKTIFFSTNLMANQEEIISKPTKWQALRQHSDIKQRMWERRESRRKRSNNSGTQGGRQAVMSSTEHDTSCCVS